MMTTNTTNDDSYDNYMDANKWLELWAKEEAKDDRQLDLIPRENDFPCGNNVLRLVPAPASATVVAQKPALDAVMACSLSLLLFFFRISSLPSSSSAFIAGVEVASIRLYLAVPSSARRPYLSRVNVRFFGVGNSDLRSEEDEEEDGVLLVLSSTSDNDNITEVDDEE